MPTSFWADPGDKRYRAAYFDAYPGRWRHGDWIIFHDDGSCVITGRSDGTLNRGGVRLGSSEFYLALEAIPQVLDSLIVHLEEGNGVLGRLVLFVQLAPGAVLTDELRADIVGRLRSSLSPRHAPDEVVAVPAIPYNLTGKKLEVPVKRLLKGESRAYVVADGTLRDPSALDAIEALVPQFAQGTPTGSEEQRHE
jgi:acetoacetyl-CoA synthetase